MQRDTGVVNVKAINTVFVIKYLCIKLSILAFVKTTLLHTSPLRRYTKRSSKCILHLLQNISPSERGPRLSREVTGSDLSLDTV
jgi:hypothetical protein